MDVVYSLHSLVRWVVVVVAIGALVVAVMGLLNRGNAKADRAVMAAFAGMIDLQTLLGIILIVWMGTAGSNWPRYQLEHAVTMIVAAGVAHLPMRWRKAEIAQSTKARNNLIVVVVVLVLVFVGVARLPQGWRLG
jgi:hypothetical protein